MTLLLSKTLDPEHDYPGLVEELAIVDRYSMPMREQHPQRRWEYALALRAASIWVKGRTGIISYDIGGAGSLFSAMVGVVLGETCCRIDPKENWTLADYLQTDPPMRRAVFCLSVLEHVDDLDQFLYHLSCLVAPGGLLFLTVDYCDDDTTYEWPEDRYHFHWMRRRIFNSHRLEMLLARFKDREFSPLGEVDWTWHGPHVFDYGFASLAMVKRS